MTGMLALAILLFGKRKEQRAVAKLSLAPVVSITWGYVMTAIGFATPMAYAIPATTPIILKSFLAAAGHIPTMITEAIGLLLVFLLYIPFVLIANKQKD